jgi:hypothetical protein
MGGMDTGGTDAPSIVSMGRGIYRNPHPIQDRPPGMGVLKEAGPAIPINAERERSGE